METACPADWCEDTTNPNTIQEKVNHLVLFSIILDGSYPADVHLGAIFSRQCGFN